MSRSRAPRSPLTRALAALGLSLALTACSGGDPSGKETVAPTPSPTVATVAPDLRVLTVPRADFCEQIDTLVLAEALPLTQGAPSPAPASGTSTGTATGASTATSTPPVTPTEAPSPVLVEWTNGDRVNGTQDGDRAHEFGCRWTLPGSNRTGAAWVYAPPVSAGRAKVLARRLGDRCTPRQTGTPFGSVSGAAACPGSGSGKHSTIRWGGLFGDAWLVCEVTGPQAVTRAAGFCPALATRIAAN